MTQLVVRLRIIIFVKELQSGGNVESDEVIEALIEWSLLSCTCIVACVLTKQTPKRIDVQQSLLTRYCSCHFSLIKRQIYFRACNDSFHLTPHVGAGSSDKLNCVRLDKKDYSSKAKILLGQVTEIGL